MADALDRGRQPGPAVHDAARGLTLARTRYLQDYLAALPDGMRSHPGCVVKANVLDETLGWLEEIETEPDPALRSAVETARGEAWIPEVLLNAVSLQIADAGYPTGDSWLREVYRRQREVYTTPMYRAVMLVMSPTLLTMGATDRWKAFRRGSELVVDRWRTVHGGRETIGTLRHPPGLYAELNVLSLGQAIVAALDACGARSTGLELVSMNPGEATFRLTYAS